MHMERMTIPYGQTESSPVITMSSLDAPFETARHDGGPGAGQYRSADRGPEDTASGCPSASRASCARAATW